MNKLPSHLLDEILFKLEPKSLAKLRCVDKSLKSHISDDLIFQSEYFSQLESTLLHISSFGSNLQPSVLSTSGKFRSPIATGFLPIRNYIIGFSSGLLLLYIHGLCVVNPLTKKFKFIDHSSSKLFPILLYWDRDFDFLGPAWETRIGFAVDKIDRNKQRFKIVGLNHLDSNWNHDSIYQFEIYSENSWRLLRKTLTCSTSELCAKPVYMNGCFHWLRIDGSIIVFDLKSEESRLIPVEFPEKSNSKLGFFVVENRLNLVCVTKGMISIYVLEMENEEKEENILIPRWNLVKEIENVKIKERNLLDWSVEAYDGRILVVREGFVIYGFVNKWKVLCSIPRSGTSGDAECRDIYLFKPCWDFVVGLDEMMMMYDEDGHDDDGDGDGDGRVTTLRKIIKATSYPL